MEDGLARIPYFYDPQSADEETRARFSGMPALNILWMMGHAGEALDGFGAMGRSIFASPLDPVLRQIAILRVAVLSNSQYERHQHERTCRQIGMDGAKIRAAIAGADAEGLTDLERKVIRFADDVILNVGASQHTFDELARELNYRDLQVLVLTIGYYMTVARFLETFQVDIEEEGREINIVATLKATE